MITTSPKLKVINNHAYANSLDLARHFRKRHDNVIRDIRDIIFDTPKEFSLLNFEERNYKNSRGQFFPFYELTRDGFALVAMGFTGREALKWKIAYINAFNEMEFQLNQKAMQSHNWEQLTLRFPDVAETLHDTYPSMTVTYALGRLTELGLMIPPISRQQIISLIKNGKLQGFKDDRQWCIYTDSFNHFVKLRSGQFA